MACSMPAEDVPRKRTRGRPAERDGCCGADALLRNARRIFAERGFYASSVRQIATASGVDAALISHHFGSKEALWVAVVDQIAERSQTMFDIGRALIEAPLTPRERVEAMIRMFVDMVFEEPDVGMFFSTAATEEGERLDVLTERMVRPFHEVFVPLIREYLDEQHSTLAPDVLFFMLTSAISKTAAYRHLMAPFRTEGESEEALKSDVLACALAMLK